MTKTIYEQDWTGTRPTSCALSPVSFVERSAEGLRRPAGGGASRRAAQCAARGARYARSRRLALRSPCGIGRGDTVA